MKSELLLGYLGLRTLHCNIAFSSGSLALIAIYSQHPLVSAFCAIVLAVIVYSALCLAPH